MSSAEGLDTKAPRRVAGNDVSCMCVRVVSVSQRSSGGLLRRRRRDRFLMYLYIYIYIHTHTQPPGYNVCMYIHIARFPCACVMSVSLYLCTSIILYVCIYIYIYAV